MMKLYSYYNELGPVLLPAPNGRQHYMHSFLLDAPTVPNGCEDYLSSVSSLALNASLFGFRGLAHLTIDEKIIKAGMSQRRPGPHVDGCFVPAENKWGHTPGGWLHNCNNISIEAPARMSVIVAANVPGCRVWRGTFLGTPKNDGDLSHISGQLGEGEIVPANYGYLLSPDCVHESMIFHKDTPRTFLRIALPLKAELKEAQA